MSENFEDLYGSSIPNQDFWVEDGISLTGNPNPSPDTILIGSGHNQNQYQFTLSDGGGGTLNLEKTPITMSETKNNLWKVNVPLFLNLPNLNSLSVSSPIVIPKAF